MADIDLAYSKLNDFATEDALLLLDQFEKKRKENHFAKYWSSDPDSKYKPFFDGIESDFAKFTKDTKIYGLLGGNRSSKTERGAFIAIAYLMGKDYFRDEPSWRYVKHLPIPEHGVNIWAVGLDFSVIRDVIWNEKLRRGHQHPGLLPQPPCPYITRISDSTFQVEVDIDGRKSTLTCKSAEAGREKFQSASIDLAWIDEETEAEVFDEIYQRTIDCSGKILLTLTPLSDISSGVSNPWVYDLYQDFLGGQQDICFVRLSALDNPFIPEDEKIKLKQKWAGHPEERARLYGDFIQRSGLVYGMWDKKVHFIEPFKIPQDWRRIASIDPAATGPTACIWGAINPSGDVYFYREYEERDLIVSDHAKNLLVRSGQDKIDLWLIDAFWASARNAETHRQGQQLYKDAGIPVRLSTRDAAYALDKMREYLAASLDKTSRHPKLYVFNTLHKFKSEIEGYVWDSFAKGSQKGQTKDKPMKKNDHLINAAQYLLALNPRGRGSRAPIYNKDASYT